MSRRLAHLVFLVALVAVGCREQATLPSEVRQPAPRATSGATLPVPSAQIVDG